MSAESSRKNKVKYLAAYLALTAAGRIMAKMTDEAMERVLASDSGHKTAWTPPADVREDDDSFIVTAELPGVSEEDIDITFSGSTLNIRGEHKPPAGMSAKEAQSCEACYGPFTRSVVLAAGVQPDGIEATLDKGILKVEIPKKSRGRPALKVPVGVRQPDRQAEPPEENTGPDA